MVKGRRPKLFYATQAGVAPPTFVFFAREASSVHFSYRRYLENRLREEFSFLGTPIRLHGTPPVPRQFASELGQHTREILEELKFSEETIAELEADGVWSDPPVAAS